MPATIDDGALALLQAPNFCHVATIRRDGTPHVVPVWVDVEDDHVLLNTAEGRAWPANLRRDPRVTLTVQDLENPYRFVSIRGRVEEDTHAGAVEHIHKLSHKYNGQDYPLPEGEQRILFRIAPEHVHLYGD